MTTCPFCKDSVAEVETIRCPACNASHHDDCWRSNGETCAVYGCESRLNDDLFGCPWCEEVYLGERRFCMVCNSPLMTRHQYQEFLEQYDWAPVSLEDSENPLLAAGYLRNNGIVARLEKRAPISMFFHRKPLLLVSKEDASRTETLLRELQNQMTVCDDCGHVLTTDETECTFCVEETGV